MMFSQYMVREAELIEPVIKEVARIGANAEILLGMVVGGDPGCGGWGDGGGESG